jgi:hypothetical protein
MGAREEAIAWAKANLYGPQLDSFMEAVHGTKEKKFFVSVTFEYEPVTDPHLATVPDIIREVEADLRELPYARRVGAQAAIREEWA